MVNRVDSWIFTTQWIVDRVSILAQIPDCACLDMMCGSWVLIVMFLQTGNAGMPGCRDAGMPGCRDAGIWVGRTTLNREKKGDGL